MLSVALGASLLTLFSGFGLGTLLLPVFAVVFDDVELAVAATAAVHLANNLWKGVLFRGDAELGTVARFGLPALVAAFGGAALLVRLEGRMLAIIVGGLIALFGLFDLVPRLKRWSVDRRWLPVGGLLSGFFGGLSGHQGALRSVFLTKLGFTPAVFVATGVFCAVLVDVARLTVYGVGGLRDLVATDLILVGAAALMAFLGAAVGKRLVGKTTMEGIRTLVGVLLITTGSLIASGLI